MKKHNDGYVLPLALVVMVVLCLVAVTVMSFSLKGLKSQQASIQRMQAQYEAAGEIEKTVARVMHITYTESFFNNVSDTTTLTGGEDKGAKSTATESLASEAGITVADDAWIENNGIYSCVVSLSETKDAVRIDCTLLLENVIVPYEGGYKLETPTVSYLSYEINSIISAEETPSGAEGGDAGG